MAAPSPGPGWPGSRARCLFSSQTLEAGIVKSQVCVNKLSCVSGLLRKVSLAACHGGTGSCYQFLVTLVTTVTQRYTQNITTSHCHKSFATSYIYILCLL